MPAKQRILLMMSGSIACAKATGLISEWVKRGDQVRVAATPSVQHFVGRATLEGLSGAPLFDDTFAPGHAMDHITLAQWADLIVVCPATANLLNKLAAGIGDDAVTTLWQAAWGRSVPMFVVPAMNSHMWQYPATRDSVARLRSWGVHVLPTAEGDLACGERGAGRMLETADIIQQVDALLNFDRASPAGRVLVTGGGTQEPIDDVRYIGNRSSGRSAASIADLLQTLGFEVSWLGARSALRPAAASHAQYYETFADLDGALQDMLAARRYDAVIHAAAVSDFSVQAQAAAGGKLPSGQALQLGLQPNPKLIARIKRYAAPASPLLVGFKLTAGASDEAAVAAVARQFAGSDADLVVHNDIAEISAGRHWFDLYARGDAQAPQLLARYEHPQALALGLAGHVGEAIKAQEESRA
jgi:phosphopantothenoylcysteine decarboxylase/phosphopantothenate--cysteine ligase